MSIKNPFSTNFTQTPQWDSRGLEKLRQMEQVRKLEAQQGNCSTNAHGNQTPYNASEAQHTIETSTPQQLREWFNAPEGYRGRLHL